MKKLYSLLLAILVAAVLQLTPLIPAQVASAAACKSEVSFLGIPPWYSNLCKEGTNDVEVEDPGDAAVIILLNLVGIAMRLAGYGAIGFVIWGGIQYVIANGDASKLASAKKTILNALIGLLITLSAVAIVTFVSGIYT